MGLQRVGRDWATFNWAKLTVLYEYAIVYPFAHWGTFEFFPCLGFYEWSLYTYLCGYWEIEQKIWDLCSLSANLIMLFSWSKFFTNLLLPAADSVWWLHIRVTWITFPAAGCWAYPERFWFNWSLDETQVSVFLKAPQWFYYFLGLTFFKQNSITEI